MQLNDLLIRRLCFLLSIAGLSSVFFLSAIQEPLTIKLSEINDSQLSDNISTKGFVSWSRINKGILFFEIRDIEEMKCVIFTPTTEQLTLVKKGAFVQVSGRLELYEGELEIIVEEVLSIESL